jgi:hypothetical protein
MRVLFGFLRRELGGSSSSLILATVKYLLMMVHGWKNFVMDNNLKPGDVCVFELTKSTGVSFQVVIFRATEQSSGPPKI